MKLKAQPCWCTVRVSTTTLLLSVCFDKIQEIAHKCNVKKPRYDRKAESLIIRKRREENCVTRPRPGKESVTELTAEHRYPDVQSYHLTTDQTQGPKMPLIKTGLKHPTKVTANKARQEKYSFWGWLFLLARVEACQAPLRPPTRLLQQEPVGWGSQTACTAEHTWEINKLHRNSVPLGSSLSLHIIVSLCMSPCNTGLFIITECLDWPC